MLMVAIHHRRLGQIHQPVDVAAGLRRILLGTSRSKRTDSLAQRTTVDVVCRSVQQERRAVAVLHKQTKMYPSPSIGQARSDVCLRPESRSIWCLRSFGVRDSPDRVAKAVYLPLGCRFTRLAQIE